MADEPNEARALVVTGGSGGIGAALCRASAERGWHVWIGYATRRSRAEALAAEIVAAGGAATAICLPLHDGNALRNGIARIAREGPILRAAVLCGAPAPDVASLLKITQDQIRRQLECAVVGNHTLIAELWRHCFRPGGGGHLLAVLSAAQGPPAAPHMAGYVAAKGGLESLLHAAAAELGRAGLRISVVRPGYVETSMLRAFEPLLLERARASAPDGRFLEPGEVARTLLQALDRPERPGTVAELSLQPETALV